MWVNKNQTGYTIVETLIVVAVTGMIFASTALMMRGQVAKNEYREGMQQIEQSMKTIINNVENGNFGTPPTNGTDDSKILVGKTIWFCTDGASVTCPSANNGSIMHAHTVFAGPSGGFMPTPTLQELGDDSKQLPAGIKFIGYKMLPGPSSLIDNFGMSVLFEKSDGSEVTQVSDMASSIGLHARLQSARLSSWNGSHGDGYILCFEGTKRGSIELGSRTSGTNIVLNLDDERCN